ncbi:MAG: C40 family peptidase [Clostridia bacterium]|nr:C40 family peptidase [Clostridia bacterium]
MMKTKHIFIPLISATVLCTAFYTQIQSAPQGTHITFGNSEFKNNIYTNSKETFIFEASEKLIKEKSSFQNSYVLLNSQRIPVHEFPSDSSAAIDFINKPICVNIIESTEDWYKILYSGNNKGYVLKNHITDSKEQAEKSAAVFKNAQTETKSSSENCNTTDCSTKGQELVDCAKKYLGVKYVYGGSSPSGFDCSGLVQYVCKNVGIKVNRTAASQFNNGKAVNKKDLMPGDLLFFAKNGRIHHVSIYAGNGQMIHAPQTGDVVKFSSFNTPYRQKEFVGARRVY